ncbi:VOC family protein [Ancylobacter oerskovii]|uniref:VOC family protein n=1 Tax=Ancylobacter oerskovii TaxID=459519 RepID=A0ABW4Z1H7_9HYPH|nr:VOC family protein [Ancylobacter oerskovii]MBS7544966.1 VOC family protein [Ancylobacter oerskovii]
MNVQAYLMLNGRTEEAIEFYKKAVGAEVTMLMRFKDMPEPPPPGMVPEGWDDKIMHSSFKVGEAELMASDGCQSEAEGIRGISLALSVNSPDEAQAKFAALSDGGQVTMPLDKTFFSPAFGTLTDRFGVSWMVVTNQ